MILNGLKIIAMFYQNIFATSKNHSIRISIQEDYEKAAALGSTFAKTQLVALNPYAAMCKSDFILLKLFLSDLGNAMLADVFAKTQRGESSDKNE